MTLTDVDLGAKVAFVVGKGRRPRAVTFGVKTARALDRYLRQARTVAFAANADPLRRIHDVGTGAGSTPPILARRPSIANRSAVFTQFLWTIKQIVPCFIPEARLGGRRAGRRRPMLEHRRRTRPAPSHATIRPSSGASERALCAVERSATCPAVWGRLSRVTDDGERQRLASTFDQSAPLYQRARPEYPRELYDRLVDVTGLKPGSELLEIGCATGKATLPFARRGLRITCLEPGSALAAEARRLLAPFDVEVIASRFEDWEAPEGRFSLVYAATAWHWIDPHVRYPKAAQALVAMGYLAFWEAIHVFPYGGDPFFDEIQEIYDEIGEGLPAGYLLPRPQELDDQRTDIEASGLFDIVEMCQYDWEVTYDAESYIDLLNTFSGHIAMRDWQRDRLYGEVRRRLALRPDGRLRRHWGGVLHIARRREG